MPKTLKATRSQKCNGCELCALEVQRQLRQVGLEGAMIRIFKDLERDPDKPIFSIEIDPRVEQTDVEKIKKVCPQDVFDVSET